jgi:hypothetical protein
MRLEHVGQVVGDRLVELVVGAGLRESIGSPTSESGCVAEPVALKLVVRHFDDPFWAERDEIHVLACVPAVQRAGTSSLCRVGRRRLPRVLVEFGDEWGQLFEKFTATRGGERRSNTDVVQPPVSVIQAKQE